MMKALEGIRVLDLGRVWAGPHCGRMLGDMGAQVIKIESLRRYDGVRGPKNPPLGAGHYPERDPGERPYNRAPSFNERNRNKFGVTIDMTQPHGMELFKGLLRISDVVVENYAAGVMKRWGIGYEAMKEVRPDIICLSMPAFGNTGPESQYVAYGLGVEQLGGIGGLTGYVGGPPMRTGLHITDPVAGMNGAAAILAALYYRAETGKGQFIDLSHREVAASSIGEALMDWTMNNRVEGRLGNRHPYMAPHGVYRCTGSDMWVAIAVEGDTEWSRFCDAIGNPPWTLNLDFADALGRWKHQDELDAHITEWTRERDHYEVANLLQVAGVSAGPVLTNWEMPDDPQHVARDWFVETEHPDAGAHDYPGMAWRMSETPGRVDMAAPCFGEHNQAVLGGLLGLSGEEIDRLTEEGIIGDEPVVER